MSECNHAGKAVACTIQMHESMVKKFQHTKTKTSDVANAILVGADCIKLYGEMTKSYLPVTKTTSEKYKCSINFDYTHDLNRISLNSSLYSSLYRADTVA